uniref:Uncharacterized protein n=1 Tax=Amphimedon queenslandica TaxID=400682 RepID=A0A1X7SZH8_AMPQE
MATPIDNVLIEVHPSDGKKKEGRPLDLEQFQPALKRQLELIEEGKREKGEIMDSDDGEETGAGSETEGTEETETGEDSGTGRETEREKGKKFKKKRRQHRGKGKQRRSGGRGAGRGGGQKRGGGGQGRGGSGQGRGGGGRGRGGGGQGRGGGPATTVIERNIIKHNNNNKSFIGFIHKC